MWMLARSNRACGSHCLVLLVRAWNGVADGEVGVVSTLLGPEGTRGLVLLQTTGLDSEFKPVIRVGGQVSQ